MQITNLYQKSQGLWNTDTKGDKSSVIADLTSLKDATTTDTVSAQPGTDGAETTAQETTDSAEKEDSLLEQQKSQLRDKIDFQEQLESSKAEAKAAAKEYENLSKCFTIARRLMNGHRVPAKDVKFLAEKQPNMYKQAILCRQENAHPKKYKRLSKDEEEEKTSSLTDDMKAKLLKLENQTDESAEAGVAAGTTGSAESAGATVAADAAAAAEVTYASIDISI